MKFLIACTGIVTFAICCVCVSCTKKDQNQTQLTRLENKWKLVDIGLDNNGNGIIDPYEIQPVQANQDDEIQFMSTGSGTQVDKFSSNLVSSLSFTWSLSNDTIYTLGTGHDANIYYLYSISSSNMELTQNVEDSTGKYLLGAYFYNIE